eukprot:7925388-Karenia_brevis.AAC.1
MAMQNPGAPPVMLSDSDKQPSFLDARTLAPTDVEMPELTTEDIDALDVQDVIAEPASEAASGSSSSTSQTQGAKRKELRSNVTDEGEEARPKELRTK